MRCLHAPDITRSLDGGVIGFKYFDLNDTSEIIINLKGVGNGRISIYTKLSCEDKIEEEIANILIDNKGDGSLALQSFIIV